MFVTNRSQFPLPLRHIFDEWIATREFIQSISMSDQLPDVPSYPETEKR